MVQITASKFKEQCLAVLDNLGPEGIVVTKHGKPVARVLPVKAGCASLIGSMKTKIQVHGDIFSTRLKWESAGGRKRK